MKESTPPELLEDPEIAAERIKLAAQKAHDAVVRMWGKRSERIEWSKDELSGELTGATWEISGEYGYDTYGRWVLNLLAGDTKDLAGAEFQVDISRYWREDPRKETWAISREKLEKTGIVFPFNQHRFEHADITHHPLYGAEFSISDFDDARQLLESLSDRLFPPLNEQVDEIEKFARHVEEATEFNRMLRRTT